MRHTSRTPACLVALGAFAAISVASGTASAGGAGGPLRDGNWNGTMAVGAIIDFSDNGFGLISEGSGNGSFNLNLSGGTATGDYVLGASSAVSLEGDNVSGTGEGVGAIAGSMQGTSTGPVLSPNQAHVDVTGSVSVNGFEVPINEGFDFGPEDLISSQLVITSSSCTIASGTWAQEFKAAVESAGANVTKFRGSWAATFKGTASGETDAALQELLTSGEAILSQWYDSGTFDAESLGDLLIDAEHFAVSGPTNDKCGAASPGAWASPLAGLVERLLVAVANSPSTTPEILRFGIAAGLRTNVLPSAGAETLGASLMAKAGELLTAAIAANDQAGIFFIGVSANSMGWTDLSDAAAAAAGA